MKNLFAIIILLCFSSNSKAQDINGNELFIRATELEARILCHEIDHLDGLTVSHADWWFNLRASNTEPLLRLNVEASAKSRMESVRDDVLNTIRS